MAKLIIIRGPSGAGKSTLADKMLSEGKIEAVYEADQYFYDSTGKYNFDFNKLGAAHGSCRRKVEEAIKAGKTIAVSNTSTRLKEFKEYIDMAEKNGYEVEVYRCTGRYQNLHGVPADKVQQMWDRMQDYPGEILV